MRKKKNFMPRWDRVSEWLITDPACYRGQWLALRPGAAGLHVELGCGKGGFLAANARTRPDILFAGLERTPGALLMAMEKARAENLRNVLFIHGDVSLLQTFFSHGEIDAIYLNFCDPWPSRKRAPRRLTHRDYLTVYRELLKPGCPLRFKTDSEPLFDFTQKELVAASACVTFRSTDRRHDPAYPGGDHMTEYETRFTALGAPIFRIEAVWR